MHQLWNGTGQNCKDRLWWHLAEIFWIFQPNVNPNRPIEFRAIPFQSWCIFWDTVYIVWSNCCYIQVYVANLTFDLGYLDYGQRPSTFWVTYIIVIGVVVAAICLVVVVVIVVVVVRLKKTSSRQSRENLRLTQQLTALQNSNMLRFNCPSRNIFFSLVSCLINGHIFYSKFSSVTTMLVELGLPSFNTVLHNAAASFNRRLGCSANRLAIKHVFNCSSYSVVPA